MPGKCRPSLRKKTLDNVMRSTLSQTDKDCIKAVFERYVEVVRCGKCEELHREWYCGLSGMQVDEDDFCSFGKEKR